MSTTSSQFVEPWIHEELLQHLDEFIRVAKIHNLEFFLDGGTLLGAVRHNGFIPHDEDIDVGIEQKDVEKLQLAFADLGEMWDYAPFHSGFKIFYKSKPKIKKSVQWAFTYLDIMIFDWDKKDGLLRYKSGMWRAFKHKRENLYPLRTYNFEGRKVKGAMYPLPYLDGGYKHKHLWDIWSHTHNWSHRYERAAGKMEAVCYYTEEQSKNWRRIYGNPPQKKIIKFKKKKK